MACEFGENLDCNKTNSSINLAPISEQNSTSTTAPNQSQSAKQSEQNETK